tara:strand:+ start:1287 stop:2657 length:1371 start_codon:yes stop_codon:yes gene_type:complete
MNIDKRIFRAYDIRGIAGKELSSNIVYLIGKAFAQKTIDHKQSQVVVGRDGRLSSLELQQSLMEGLIDSGLEVIDIGLVPTPLLYFATTELQTGTGVMVTGSHNPPEYNGLKMMVAEQTLAGVEINDLYEKIVSKSFTTGKGSVRSHDLKPIYSRAIKHNIVLNKPLKVVVDCGNGAGSDIAPKVLSEIGCHTIPLFCEVDGRFPNHHPDPADPDTLSDLITEVRKQNADVGIAFDGDADRIGVVTEEGDIIWPDKLMMLLAEKIIARNPKAPIIYDVKCSRNLEKIIEKQGGQAVMCKTGHSHIKAKMKETGAPLGGEFSGHICIAERWHPFDDAIYAAARLIELLSQTQLSAGEVFSSYPSTYNTPEIKIPTTEEKKFEIIEKLSIESEFQDGVVSTIDGLRVDYPDGWGLIRASNTSPVLTLRFEGEDQLALERIKKVFRLRLEEIEPNLSFL